MIFLEKRSVQCKFSGPVEIEDSTLVGDRRYKVNVDGLRTTGECFWDTLRYYGISEANIINAAAIANLAVDQPVLSDSIGQFLTI
jgi:hypothetical protein